MALKLASLGGSNTVTVTEGANSASDTGSPTVPAVVTAANAYYAQAANTNDEYVGTALNLDSLDRLDRCFLGNAPNDIFIVRQGIAAKSGTTGNTFILGREFTSNFYTSAALIGATARVARVVDGSLQERVSEIVAANVDCWPVEAYIYPHSGGSLSSAQAVGGTTIRVALQNGWRVGVPYYIGIAAVTQAGSIGPITHATTTTIASIPTGTSASVTHSSIVTLTGAIDFTANALLAPTGVTLTEISSGVWEISCSAVAGAFGYRAFVSDVNPTNMAPNQLRTIALASDGGFSMQPGVDHLMVSRTFLEPNDSMYHFRVAANEGGRGLLLARDWWARSGPIDPANNPATPYQWNRFDSGDPAPATGLEWYMARTYKAGQTQAQGGDQCAWIGTATDTFYEQGSTSQIYDVEFWHAASATYNHNYTPLGGSNVVFAPGEAGETTAASQALTSTTTWQKVNLSFRCAAVPTDPRTMFFGRPNTDAVTLKIAGFKISRRGETPLDLPAASKAQIGSGSILRFHMYINGAGFTMDQLTMASGMGGIPNIATSLRIAKELGARPYLQAQWLHTAAEWTYLAAFLAAPVSSGHPAAQRRADQGQFAPWVDEFSEMYLEDGNEPWNRAGGYIGPVSVVDQVTAAAVSDAQLYGHYTKRMIDAFEASPYWSALSGKLKFLGCGFISTGYGRDAAIIAGPSKIEGVLSSVYIGGDFASFASRLLNGTGFYTMSADYYALQRPLYAARKTELDAIGVSGGAYEAGIGYAQPGQNTAANVIENEIIGKSRSAISGTLDSILGLAAQNAKLYTYFSEGPGDRWKTRALPNEGGQEYGPWRVIRQIQEEMGAFRVKEVLAIKQGSISVTTVKGTYSIPPYSAYRIDSITYPGRVCIAICPHDIDRSLLAGGDALYNAAYDPEHALRVTTGLTSAASVRKLSYCGDFREHNRYPVGFRLNSANGLYDIADATCVAIAPDWVTITPPSVARIDVNADIEPVIGGPLVISFRGAT
jgi:hypothetical protein